MKKSNNKFKMLESHKILLIFMTICIIMSVAMYFIIPIVFNYPANALVKEFQVQIDKIVYSEQTISLLSIILLATTFTLHTFLKKVIKFEKKVRNGQKIGIDEVKEIRKRCGEMPMKFYRFLITAPLLTLPLLFILTKANVIAIVKITILAFTFLVFCATITMIFTQKYYKNIILKTYATLNEYVDLKTKKQLLSKRLFSQITPVFYIAILLITLFAYANNSNEKGNTKYFYYKSQFKEGLSGNIEDTYKYLKSLEYSDPDDFGFIVSKNDLIASTNGGELSKFFLLYMNTFVEGNEGRVHDYYGVEAQGYVKKIMLDNKEYYVGVHYITTTLETLMYFFWILVILFLVVVILLWYWSKVVAENVNEVVIRLQNIAKVKNNDQNVKNEILPVLSNDEFGSLSIAYNEIQTNTRLFVKELQEKQDIIVKQQQLVSIGELAGGVAHDINTPISAIKTGILMLDQMGSAKTDNEKEILQRMDNCASKIITIVNSMRNQIRNLGSDTNIKFKISDVVNDIKIITYHEVKKNNSEVVINIEDDLYINGDPTKLGQVLTNLVVNAAQAYGQNQSGRINLTVTSAPNNLAMIKVTDYAGGLDESITPFIFKNILTTKGTFGTGLGLYLAYSVIKGNFNGDITFETEKGMGTTFYITIPRA